MEISTYLTVLGGLMIVVTALIGWQYEARVWQIVAEKPDDALQYLRKRDCLIDQKPDNYSKTLFTGPFQIVAGDGREHSVFLKSDKRPSIYRGLLEMLV